MDKKNVTTEQTKRQIEGVLRAQNEIWLSKHKIYRKYGKRVFDVTVSIVALFIFFLPFAVCALLIWMNDHGSALFLQDRVGRNLKVFKIYKFRTMVLNAEQKGTKYTQSNDSRVTRIGKLLRQTSVDELPQIWNVFTGTMSFVGYRPNVAELIDWRDLNCMKIYCTRPGITGYAQLYGRSSNTYEEYVSKNLKYLEDASFFVDLKIIILTACKVIFPSGRNNKVV